MLVLTRKIGETIFIDEKIVITLLTIDGGKVRLGIAAPEAVQIWRGESMEERKERLRNERRGARIDDKPTG